MDGGGTDAAPRGHRAEHLTWRKSQPQDNLEGYKATFLIQLVVILICWNDISKRKTSRHNQVRTQGHWPQPRLAVVEPEILVDHFSPVLLHHISALLEIQETVVLFPVLLNVTWQARGAWAFPGIPS